MSSSLHILFSLVCFLFVCLFVVVIIVQ
jgi:hypothetical protein